MKEAFEKMTGMPDAWTNPALMVSRNAFIQGWEARTQHDVDATIIQYHEATIKRLEKRIEELAQPAQEPWCMKMNGCKTKCEDCPDEPAQTISLTSAGYIADEDDDIQVYQRPWVGLTVDERYECVHGDAEDSWDVAEAVEAKLKEKNT